MSALPSILMFFGIATLLLSWLYLTVISFKDDYAWGFMTLFLPPLSYTYSLFRLGKAWEPLALAFIGLVLVVLGC
jgi:hypothetical protein